MKTFAFRPATVIALCLLSAFAAALAAHLTPRAHAAPSATSATAVPLSAAQGAIGGSRAYTVLPITDYGSGNTWTAYAMIVSPAGHVTIVHTHPKKPEQFGTVAKEFDVR